VISADRVAAGNQGVLLQRRQNSKSPEHDILFHRGAVNTPPAGKGTIFLRFLIESGLDTTLASTTGPKPVENISLKIGLAEASLNAGNWRAGIWVNGRDAVAYGAAAKPGKDVVSVRRRGFVRGHPPARVAENTMKQLSACGVFMPFGAAVLALEKSVSYNFLSVSFKTLKTHLC
jgi:hypothetical protein